MTSGSVFSTYVITEPCIGMKDGTCVEVCPVDCIETTPDEDQFYVDPALCIACEQCVLVCPVDAIFLEHEVPPQWGSFVEKNADFFRRRQQDVPSVSTEQAERMIRAAQARADELGVAVSITIVNQLGNPVASGRMGLAAPDHDEASHDKAYSAVVFGLSTAQLNERAVNNAPTGVDRERIVLEAGGIPFGRPYVVGAVGVAGGTPQQDQECSRAAVTAS